MFALRPLAGTRVLKGRTQLGVQGGGHLGEAKSQPVSASSPQDEADGPWPSDEGGYGEGQSRMPGAGFVWTDGTLADPTGDDGARLFQGLDSRTPGWWGWTRGPSGSHSPAARSFGNSRTVQHPRECSPSKRMNGNQSWAWGAPEASLPPSLWLAGSRVAPP